MLTLPHTMTPLQLRVLTGFILGLLVIATFVVSPWIFSGVWLFVLGRILGWELPRIAGPTTPRYWLLAPWYPTFSIGLMIYQQWTGYDMVNLFVLMLVGAHDSGAYLIGSHYGRHSISTSLSPNKTWEGFLGGFALSCLCAYGVMYHLPTSLFLGTVIPLVLSCNFATLSGDLFESYLKRTAGIKDSGTLLPGHGGLLDRIDGLLFALPVMSLVRTSIMHLLA